MEILSTAVELVIIKQKIDMSLSVLFWVSL